MKKYLTIISPQLIACLFAACLFCSASFSQRLSASVGLGISSYQGDLSNGGLPLPVDLHPAISLGVAYDITDRFRIRANITSTTVSAADSNGTRFRKLRNLSFQTKIFEVGLLSEFDLKKNNTSGLVPYVFAGPSLYHFDPTTVLNGKKYHLHDYGTEGQYLPANTKNRGKEYSLTQLNIQLGIGVRYIVSDKLSVGAEISYRYLTTDYLDDVGSRGYVSAADFGHNTVAFALADRRKSTGVTRGVPTNKDSYNSFQVRANYRFDLSVGGGYGNSKSHLKCPRF